MKTIAVFNNTGGVGKTSLVYHLAWMYANLDYDVVVADLDPQANLTTMFLSDEDLEALWERPATIQASIEPLLAGTGDVTMPHLVAATVGVSLVAGDMRLSGAEDELSSQWPDCLDGKQRAFRVLSAIWRALRLAANEVHADFVLVDVGPNLGALNRAALVARGPCGRAGGAGLVLLAGLAQLGPNARQVAQGVAGTAQAQSCRRAADARRRHETSGLCGAAARGAVGPSGQGVWAVDGTHPRRIPGACLAQITCGGNGRGCRR